MQTNKSGNIIQEREKSDEINSLVSEKLTFNTLRLLNGSQLIPKGINKHCLNFYYHRY